MKEHTRPLGVAEKNLLAQGAHQAIVRLLQACDVEALELIAVHAAGAVDTLRRGYQP